MKKNSIKFFLGLVLGFCFFNVQAQQDAQYTQYMYNTLSVNPAYAGSRDVFSFVGLYRTQWVGLDGAPDTFTASMHSPLSEKVGIGLNVTNDRIFITSETYIDIDFSYTIKTGEEGQLAFGLKGGGHFLDIDTQRAIRGPYNVNDAGSQVNIDNKFSPQFGLGLYYYTDKFYLGLSAPNILETEHFDENSPDLGSFATAKERINLYLIAGRVFELSEDIDFKPAVLFKGVAGAPLQADLSANFLFNDRFTAGLAYRWSAALSAQLGFQISDELMLGFAYDRETTELQRYNDGSFEVFLRYELFKRNDKMISPRFF
ncbi:PorP/SprF family type IX secretion system membrane protein [Aurantibacter aestuarii]|uniref:Type IX secretion system membrane protein PorP/SprF n=1 Tax=Aurantibacter aestuarii TaxID=1266046 RepID=A0A2T1N4R9_9FLAO|nr:type IX secretion system membrane protein PorP/SprF [Aurantibacter aestuarii]PSG86264.1 hypothetical protein C7H52_11240 [Aurantibacter aestuarii]